MADLTFDIRTTEEHEARAEARARTYRMHGTEHEIGAREIPESPALDIGV